MTFYTGLRDNTAGPLIAQFGQTGTLRQSDSTYDPATGVATAGADTDTAIKLLDLPKPDGVFESELEEQMDGLLLVASKELAAASIIPRPGDLVIWTKEGASRTGRILAKKVVAPSGVAVIEKWGVAIG